jgi:hypothetical protein
MPTVSHYVEYYYEVLSLLDLAKKVYTYIKLDYKTDVYIVEIEAELFYKVNIELIKYANK